MRDIGLIAIAFGLATSAIAAEKPPITIVTARPDISGSWTPTASDTELLPANAAESDRLSVAEGAWTPTATQIEAALTAVEHFVALKDAPSLWAGKQAPGWGRSLRNRNLRSYFIRAQGVIASDPNQALAADVNGKPMVELYAFCEVSSDAWKSPGYYIWDGGDCYFDALYDPKSGSVVSLRINGEG